VRDRGPSIEDIKREAQKRIDDVLSWLGVDEKPSTGGYISMCNPQRKDRHPSFTIWIKGAAIGAWKDHTDDGPGGLRGDVIDLVSYLNGWWSAPKKGRALALRWLSDKLGLATVDHAQLRRDRDRSRRDQIAKEKKRDEDLQAKQARAFSLFTDEAKPSNGSIVETYLRARGIELAALPAGPRGGVRWPHAIRFLERSKHTESGKVLPAMIACCTDTETREIFAVHRTWIKPDGSGKADVNPVKKVWPSFGGLVIPLWRGDTNMNVRTAIENGVRETLVLTEGIEDGLTAVMAAPQFRTWAFISLGNLAGLKLPECIDGVIVHRQTEWSNRTAVSSFERGKASIEAQGVPVAEVTAFAGKDLNDTLRGAA
jgi:hypothetical protein